MFGKFREACRKIRARMLSQKDFRVPSHDQNNKKSTTQMQRLFYFERRECNVKRYKSQQPEASQYRKAVNRGHGYGFETCLAGNMFLLSFICFLSCILLFYEFFYV